MPARRGNSKKGLYRSKVKKARKVSSTELRQITRDVKRTDWSGKAIGLSKRARKPAARVLNERYRANKRPLSSFYTGNYSMGELEAIARGRACEAWTFTMRRDDVPQAARQMAREALERRKRRARS